MPELPEGVGYQDRVAGQLSAVEDRVAEIRFVDGHKGTRMHTNRKTEKGVHSLFI